MKISFWKTKGCKPCTMQLEYLLSQITAGKWNVPVAAYRSIFPYTRPDAVCQEEERLPDILFAGEGTGTGGIIHLENYSGLVRMRVPGFTSCPQAEVYRTKAAELPFTLAAFVGADGCSVEIVTRFTLPDGSLPVQQEAINAFHAHALRRAGTLYRDWLEYEFLPGELLPVSLCRVSDDPGAVYRPDAMVLKMEQPLRMPVQTFFSPACTRNVPSGEYTGNEGELSPEKQSAEKVMVNRLTEFMHRTLDLRFNVLRQDVEYREKRSYDYRYHPLDERMLNSICLRALHEGIRVWDKDVRRYVRSDAVPKFDPLEGFLWSLPAPDGGDYIRELAGRVPCRNPHWEDFFYRWFLSMVAYWLYSSLPYANCISPILTGGQGTGKSTFCRRLLPPELQDYYTDALDLSASRRTELCLTRFGLINLDEFDAIPVQKQAYLKHLFQKPVLQVAAPYKSTVLRMRRYASFIATSNNTDLLSDPTGSRRFLCIEITGSIDNTTPVDYPRLYAQAVAALRKKERYWFTPEEERLMVQENTAYQLLTVEEQLFHRFFHIPEQDEEGEWLLAAEILLQLCRRSGMKLSVKRATHFGRILKKLEIPSRQLAKGVFYRVVRSR